MTPQTTPTRINLKKDEKLEIEWQDGRVCVYPISFLRASCPCAGCKAEQEERAKHKGRLKILSGNQTAPLQVLSAAYVGNYAIQIEWSDNHGSGIYSFQYLREICDDVPK